MNKLIGCRIKELRLNRKVTLKELSEKTSLSTGFLSQLERGLTSITIDSLSNIAQAFQVDLSYFLIPMNKKKKNYVQKNYEQYVESIEDSVYINYTLSNMTEDKKMIPRLVEILPISRERKINNYKEHGEEFIYVLEGIVTIFIDGQSEDLYPGDSIHITSNNQYKYVNYTNKMCKIIHVSILI